MAALERALLDEIGIDTVFGEDQADETGQRVERVMIKFSHMIGFWLATRRAESGQKPYTLRSRMTSRGQTPPAGKPLPSSRANPGCVAERLPPAIRRDARRERAVARRIGRERYGEVDVGGHVRHDAVFETHRRQKASGHPRGEALARHRDQRQADAEGRRWRWFRNYRDGLSRNRSASARRLRLKLRRDAGPRK